MKYEQRVMDIANSIRLPIVQADVYLALRREKLHTIRLIKRCARHAKGASADDMVRMILKKLDG